MKLIKWKIKPLNIEIKLKELLSKHRSKQKLFTVTDYGKYTRLCRLNEFKRSEQRKQNIYTYLTLWVFCIATIIGCYGLLYLVNFIVNL